MENNIKGDRAWAVASKTAKSSYCASLCSRKGGSLCLCESLWFWPLFAFPGGPVLMLTF